jgi:hypothetical protein
MNVELGNPEPGTRNAERLARRCALTCALLALSIAVAAQSGRKFFPDDPIWVEPITQNVTTATRYEPDLTYEALHGLFVRPGDRVLGQRARNLNTVDEVPDGMFFVNRAGRMTLTPEIVARAANTSPAPAPGVWTVVSAKSDGVTPGFTVRDSTNQLWFVKFDPPGWTGMATGSEMVAAKLFWAVGYYTAEYHIERLTPERLRLSPDAKIEPFGEPERAMEQADVASLLKRVGKRPDGGYRVILSRALPTPVGRIRFEGTRADDPNDVIPHEHRRELRGYSIFAAWLNHVDVKGINSMASLVTENGRSFIRGYLLDFGSTLGSAALGPRERWEGYEGLVEPGGDILRRMVSFGFLVPEWRTMEFYEAPAVGRFPASHDDWDPREWRGHISNAAFHHARDDDRFWAAHKLSFITNEMIDAAITEGRFGDPAAEKALGDMIKQRRDRILQTYLPAVNPIVDPALADGRLTFTNAAVAANVAPAPEGYTAEWATFDNATGATSAIGTTRGTSPLAAPQLPATAAFIRVKVVANTPAQKEWADPVTIYFRRATNAWELAGFERMP